jgi:FSR family fosmidomycin resistance protein-like MFS transporter
MKKRVILLLAAGHGLNDCIAGYFLGILLQLKLDLFQISMGLFLYNLLAFGGQYPVALLLEKMGKPKQFLLLAYGLNVLAVAVFFVNPQFSIVLAGIASAIYHVAGGTVCAEKNKAFHIGLFAAPGVAGLIAGGYFAYEGIHITWILLAASLVFLVLLTMLTIQKKPVIAGKEPAGDKKMLLDQHDLVMILLLTVISLRSVIWNVFQLIHEKNYEWLLAIAAAACIGKIAGGWLADKIGWRLYTFISLMAATPLISFFRKEIVLLCVGIGLLQSSIPATTSLLIQSMKGKTERAIGLSFGTAIIAGAIIFYAVAGTFFLSTYVQCGITAVMFSLLWFAGREGKPGFYPNKML